MRNHSLPALRPFGYAALASTVIAIGIYLGGRSETYTPVSGGLHRAVVGKGEPIAWIIVDKITLGSEYGRSLRRYLQDHQKVPALGFISPANSLPSSETIVLAGPLTPAVAQSLKAASPKRLILLNPPFFPAEIKSLLPAATVSPIFGEFSQSPSQSVWRTDGPVTTVEGAGDYLPQWPAAVLEVLAHQ